MAKKEITFEEICRDITARKFQPVYVLMGEEPFFIDQITDLLLKSVLEESERDFNQIILYGADTDALWAAAHRPQSTQPWPVRYPKGSPWWWPQATTVPTLVITPRPLSPRPSPSAQPLPATAAVLSRTMAPAWMCSHRARPSLRPITPAPLPRRC